MKKLNVKSLALIGILGALGGMLMVFFHFPIPFLPPFMEFDLASVPEMIGGFAMGPYAAVLIVIVKLLVKLVLRGSDSMLTGELSNLFLSLAYVLPAVFIYNRMRNKHSAKIGMITGTLITAALAVVTNLLFIFPFYAYLYGYTMPDIINMCAAINPMLSNITMIAILGIVPFNLIKFGAVSTVTLLLYKKISPLMKNFIRS